MDCTQTIRARRSIRKFKPGASIPREDVETMLEAVQDYYMIYLVLGLSVTFLVILFLRFLLGPRKGAAERGVTGKKPGSRGRKKED